MGPLLLVVGLVLLLVPTLLLVVGLGLFVRLWLAGGLQDGLAYAVFLHGRRTRLAVLFVIVAITYVLAGVFGTLGMMGYYSPSITDLVSTPTFLGGSIALLLLFWFGLRPRPATVAERAVLDGDAPRVYAFGAVDRFESKP